MLIDRHQRTGHRRGWIEVIAGCMFSGKTEELIRRLKRAKIAKQEVEIFKPALDIRYDEVNIVSHDANSIHSTPVPASSNIMLLGQGMDVIGIDEAQFFDDQLPHVCQTLANQGSRIIIAGLDMDYLGQPFGPIPHLMAIADQVTKVQAVCMHCGDLATHSHRLVGNNTLIHLGEKESYIPLCRSCYASAMKLLQLETKSKLHDRA